MLIKQNENKYAIINQDKKVFKLFRTKLSADEFCHKLNKKREMFEESYEVIPINDLPGERA